MYSAEQCFTAFLSIHKIEAEMNPAFFSSFQGIVPTDVHLLPGQLKDVHVAIDEVRNVPPPLPSIPRPRVAPSIEAYPNDDVFGGGGILGQDRDNNNHKQYHNNYRYGEFIDRYIL